MYTSFAMAILASAAVAAPGNLHGSTLNKRYEDPKFGEYMATFNKGPRSTAEYEMRQELYHDLDNLVGQTNREADASGKKNPLRLKHNWLSDRTEEERNVVLGLKQGEQEERSLKLTKQKKKNKKDRKNKNRKLAPEAMNVDWAAANRMSPVKNQGGCGSCWAFASTTALEGTIAIRKDEPAVRLSEQQSVDCTFREKQFSPQFDKNYNCWGCEGCWMSNSWDFMKEQGVMAYSDYTYSGRAEQQCEHDYDNLYGYVEDYTQVSGSVDNMLEKLETHPLSIALDAGSRKFQQYASGVLSFSDCGSNNYQLNHAVVVVGYTQSGDDDGDDNDDDNDDDDNDNDDDDNTPAPVGDCKVTKWWHSCESDTVENRRLQDSAGNDNYFKVQNSWGTNWGDDGFILMEIKDGGNGTCGMYNVMEWVDGCEIGDAGCSAGR